MQRPDAPAATESRYRFQVKRNELRRTRSSDSPVVVWSVWDNEKLEWVGHHVTRDEARRGRQFAALDAWAKERIGA